MRLRMHHQQPLLQAQIDHEHARELVAMSEALDRCSDVLLSVEQDLLRGRSLVHGRPGMSARQVVCALVIRQMTGFSYEQLAFHLADSASYQSFCRIGAFEKAPSKSTLQENIKRVSAESLEKLNQGLLAIAVEDGIEDGNTVRGDCTAVETTIHAPRDSWLLYDTVRVLARTMKKAQKFDVTFQNHTRRAKRRSCAIPDTGSSTERVRLYSDSDLLEVTENTLQYAESAIHTLSRRKNPKAAKLREKLTKFVKLGHQVVDQTRRRVFYKESVPASEKVVSIFEPHTDIIVKSRRDVEYGHKICLTTGPSSMALDCIILSGNPADSSLATEMMERHEEMFDHVPEQVAFDGGFASRANLEELKDMGIEDVVFSKRRGIEVHEMVKESWAYKWLRNFRAGIEGCISFFKRSFGLSRCSWKGVDSFKSYVWASIFSANLLIYARHRLAQT